MPLLSFSQIDFEKFNLKLAQKYINKNDIPEFQFHIMIQ
ncbi:MAG: hypothetical protein ACI924_000508 [Flavobacterium sp.]|jgi:hypothetical protein